MTHKGLAFSYATSLVLVLTVTACGPSSRGDDDDDTPATCTAGQSVCVGNEVHECSADGTVGPLLETCSDGMTCSAGSCTSSSACGAQGVELIYVVDTNNGFYSFDPTGDAHTFNLVGTLACPNPGNDLRGEGVATPFSMSVDRGGTAWVLFSSGKLFRVSTADASCTESTWTVGSGGFELFGMGFVVDQAGGNTEKLWIAGGPASQLESGASNLGVIDIGTLAAQSVGALPSNGEYSPEFTGTGAAELYAYYPGQDSFVARINKTSASSEQSWDLPPLGDGIFTGVVAWAFAHWGGRFYIFATVRDSITLQDTSQVIRLDPTSGQAVTVLPSTGKMVVGAGVSTCAPITID